MNPSENPGGTRERWVACFHATKSRVSMFQVRRAHAYPRLRRVKACNPPSEHGWTRRMPGAWKAISLTAVILIAAGTGAPSFPKERVGDDVAPVVGRMQIRETDHFTIAYDTSYEALRPLIGRLEGTYDAILRFVAGSGLSSEAPTDRMEVILFNRHEDFTRYLAGIGLRGASVAGIYHQQSNVAAFCNMADNPDLQQITRRIEQFRKQLQQLEGKRSRAPGTRRRRRELRGHLSTLRLRRDALVKRFNRFVIQHEAAHQMFFNLGVHIHGADNPNWLVEGLACQFEVPQRQAGAPRTANLPVLAGGQAAGGMLSRDEVAGKHVPGPQSTCLPPPAAGEVMPPTRTPAKRNDVPTQASRRTSGSHTTLRINHVRLGDFRDALHAAPNAKSISDDAYGKAFADGSFVSLADLISDPKLLGGHVAFRYAQAWALVYYLQPTQRDAFVTYLRRLRTRTPGETAEPLREIDEFKSAFGEPDEAFQRAWVKYMLRLRFDRREAGR